ncbi:hypothetical protein F4801DRAFT_316653 [Xylaria longipes]|nr:hypothetical protein F4801DRAFT_316653 [Xylaria longipes]
MLQGNMHPLVWRPPHYPQWFWVSPAIGAHWHFALLLRPQNRSFILSCVDAVNLPFPPSPIPNARLNTIILSFFPPTTPSRSFFPHLLFDSRLTSTYSSFLPSGLRQFFLLDVNLLPSPLLLRSVVPLLSKGPLFPMSFY